MEQILEKIMNFINENTMLLIIICIFLIVILVIYLIDNTIKSKKLEKEELEKNNTPEPVVLESNIPEEEVAPVVEEIAPAAVEAAPEVPVEQTIEEKPEEITSVVEEEVPIVEEPKVEPVVDYNIEELLNKDYTANNEIVNNIPNEPAVESKSKYTNDKKLSDIFGKKKENNLDLTQDYSEKLDKLVINNKTEEAKKIETTQDFSDELDRILKKLNEEDSKNNYGTLEETNDYTNMF